jgi:hypothetical protein
MTSDDAVKAIIAEYNANVESPARLLNESQDKDSILRDIANILDEIDYVFDWPCAIDDFSLVIPANSDNKEIPDFDMFRAVICKTIIGNAERVLDYYPLTDFKIRSTGYYGGTNDDPTDYSTGGNKIYVGPGNMTNAITVFGQVRRKLVLNDIQYLPGRLITAGVLRNRFKKGTPANIASWNGWNVAISNVKTSYNKRTGEERALRTIDPQIARNTAFLNSL